VKQSGTQSPGFPASKYFQNVIDGLTDDLKIVDPQYRVVYVNEKAAQRLFKSPDQILGQKCYEIFNHFDKPCPYCTTLKTFATGETLHTEFGYTDTEGDPYFFLLTTFPVRNEHGEIPYVVEITRDVTQEKRLEQELIKSRTLKAIGQFAAELAHEVRNPLNAISFQMALLKKIKTEYPNDPCTGQLLEATAVVNEEIARLTKITQDFLTFTRQESLRREPVDLKDVVNSSVNLLKGDLEPSRIDVSVSEKDGPHVAMLDRDRFRQVIINLLSNSINALGKKGKIEISLASGTQDTIIMTVSDNGPGIPRSLSKKVFDPFFSGSPKGSGLGLSIVKNIVEAHGGTIILEPTDAGAFFKIMLPRAS